MARLVQRPLEKSTYALSQFPIYAEMMSHMNWTVPDQVPNCCTIKSKTIIDNKMHKLSCLHMLDPIAPVHILLIIIIIVITIDNAFDTAILKTTLNRKPLILSAVDRLEKLIYKYRCSLIETQS